MNDLTFDHLSRLYLVWLVLATAAAGLYGIWQRRRALRQFADAQLVHRIAPRMSVSWTALRVGLVTTSLLCTAFSLLGPRWGEREERVLRRGVDVLVLLDVSKSMLARDIAPNRLERAKVSLVEDLLPAMGGDRVGLITFAGLPSLKCPLTNDYGFFRLAMQDVSTSSSPVGGSLIGDAIRKADAAFDDALQTRKVVLLITDGEDHDSYPVEAARALWKDHQIPIVAVALGDEREGARIPVGGDDGERYLTYREEIVWSRANFDQLREIAAASPLNAFVPAGTRNFDLGQIYRERILPAVESSVLTEFEHVPQPARSHVFSAMALTLLLVDSLLRDGASAPLRAAVGVELRAPEAAA